LSIWQSATSQHLISSQAKIFWLRILELASVLEVIRVFETASGRDVPYAFKPRRDGDVAICFADVLKAKARLGWKAKRDLQAMCADHWRWQTKNPFGYDH
jgi:UDP-glucose 4-epimerase